jgi:subtilisin family serine protease
MHFNLKHVGPVLVILISLLIGSSSSADQNLFPPNAIMVELIRDDTSVLNSEMDEQLNILVQKYGTPQVAPSFALLGKDQNTITAYVNAFLSRQKIDVLFKSLGLTMPAVPPLQRVHTLTFTAKNFDRTFAIKTLKASKNFVSVTEDWITKFKAGANSPYAWTTLNWLKPYVSRYVDKIYRPFLAYLDKTHPASVTKFLASLSSGQAADYYVHTAATSHTSDHVCHCIPLSNTDPRKKSNQDKKQPDKPAYTSDVLLATLWDDNTGIWQNDAVKKIFARYGQPTITQRYQRLGKTYDEVITHQQKILQKFPARSQRRIEGVPIPALNRRYKLVFSQGVDIGIIMAELCATNQFKDISPDYYLHTTTVPNDPYYSSSNSWSQTYDDLWGLKKIDAATAWDTTTGDSNLIVAVIDSGLDFTHAELTNNTYSNSGETAYNGVDDDGNGYVDDIHGYDFYNSDANPTDDMGHGTHVSGTIAAEGDNGIGIVGVMWHAKILPLKVCSSDGSCSISALEDALVYAADMGAVVANMSLGGSSDSEEEGVQYAYGLGVVLVAASGNSNTDCNFNYPSGFVEVLSIGSSTTSDTRSEYSNYCEDLDIVAPGGDDEDSSSNDIYHNILSLLATGTNIYGDGVNIVNTDYYRARGTSMATPHVTGVVGLLLSANPTLTVEEVRQVLRTTADDVEDAGWDINTAYGRLDVGAAVNATSACEALITSPVIYGLERDDTITVSGYAGGNSFASYQIDLYSGNTSSGTLVTSSTGSGTVSAGTLATFNVTTVGITDGIYTLALTVYNSAGNTCGKDYRPFVYTTYLDVVQITDDSYNNYFGHDLATGDFDGDGNKDLIVGAPNDILSLSSPYSTDQGKVYLVKGGYAYTQIENVVSDVSLVPVSWIGKDVTDLVGRDIDVLDIDGDHLDDVAIAAAGDSTSGTYAGKVCIFLGKNSSGWTLDMPLSSADYCFTGDAAYDFFGGSLGSVGDADLDGIEDLAVSSCGNDSAGTDYGKIYILYSSSVPGWTSTQSTGSVAGTELTGDYSASCDDDTSDYFWEGDFNYSISGGSDFTGDGVADVVFGNGGHDYYEGGVYVYSAATGGIADLLVAERTMPGLLDIQSSVFMIPGASGYSASNDVSTLSTVITLTDSSTIAQLPSTLLSLDDMNGDSNRDFAIGTLVTDYFNSAGGMTTIHYGDTSLVNGTIMEQSHLFLKDSYDSYFFGTALASWNFDSLSSDEITVGASLSRAVYVMDNKEHSWTTPDEDNSNARRRQFQRPTKTIPTTTKTIPTTTKTIPSMPAAAATYAQNLIPLQTLRTS